MANAHLREFLFMDGLKLKHSPLLVLGDGKEGNSHYSGHAGGSNSSRGVIIISGHILLYIFQDTLLGLAQDT